MAKYERRVMGNINDILRQLDETIMSGSASASFEEESTYQAGEFRTIVRVYERFSWTGSNRVSLTLIITGGPREFLVSAITSGGSQGMFMKWNTIGESSFLETVIDAIDQL